MARATRNTKFETRTSRSKLKPNHEPYWVSIGQGLYLGYRKGKNSSNWLVRYYIYGKYKKKVLGKADDYQDANNIDVLNYFQAQAKARNFSEEQVQNVKGVSIKPIKVNDAVNNYLDWFKIHRKSYKHTVDTIRAHISPKLGNVKIVELTPSFLRKWHENLAKQPAKLRSTKFQQNYRKCDDRREGLRKRKVTANRVLSVLKAILNHAWREGLVVSDEAWRKVKPFRNVESSKIRYLQLDECRRLINACSQDFRFLVRAALLTGCRYGELIRIAVNDFNEDKGTLYIRDSKNGKPRYIPLTDEGIHFFGQAVIGKSGEDLIFVRADGGPWKRSHQSRRLREICEKVKIKPAISFHVLRHTYASLLASSGVPLQVIAELLGHSDTHITSKHYAHLMPSFVADTLRAHLPNFADSEYEKVKKIKVV